MSLSDYFDDLNKAYRAELEDLQSDSEGKNVLSKRLAEKRSQFAALLPMMAFAPEMVAPVFHGGVRFIEPAVLLMLSYAEPEEFPDWDAVRPAVQLPGFAAITLAGLTVVQAAERLAAEPDLGKLDFTVTFLPVRNLGGAGLKHYGYDFFDQEPSTFAPTTDVPVPSDYVVGPGDQFTVQLYGSQNKMIRLTVGRDGQVHFPELGPISVAGRPYNAVKSDIESRVSRQMIGVRAS